MRRAPLPAPKEGKAGLFEVANGGTIFMDEVGELPLPAQAKLLRVLENGEFRRLGGSQVQKTDVRIIAATNRNLKEMVEEKTFRDDLYYRLNVVPVTIPPLRERPGGFVRAGKSVSGPVQPQARKSAGTVGTGSGGVAEL